MVSKMDQVKNVEQQKESQSQKNQKINPKGRWITERETEHSSSRAKAERNALQTHGKTRQFKNKKTFVFHYIPIQSIESANSTSQTEKTGFQEAGKQTSGIIKMQHHLLASLFTWTNCSLIPTSPRAWRRKPILVLVQKPSKPCRERKNFKNKKKRKRLRVCVRKNNQDRVVICAFEELISKHFQTNFSVILGQKDTKPFKSKRQWKNRSFLVENWVFL